MMKRLLMNLLGCICCASVSNASNSNNNSQLFITIDNTNVNDFTSMQHSLLNLFDMTEKLENNPLDNIKCNGKNIDRKAIKNIFKLDEYVKSGIGQARKFINDIISCLVKCNYKDLNTTQYSDYFNKLQEIVNSIKDINYNYNNLDEIKDLLTKSVTLFVDICTKVKNNYNFIPNDPKDFIISKDNYRNVQYELGKIFMRKINPINDLKCILSQIELEDHEILLHKALLVSLYCDKLRMDFQFFPRDFNEYYNGILSDYWSMISKQCENDLSKYFK